MSEQPNALRLAALLDEGNAVVYRKHATEAAAELRRLQAERDELLEALDNAAHALKEEGRHYQAAVTYQIIAKTKGEQA